MSDRKFCSWEEAVLWLKSQPDQADQVKACYYDDPLLEAAQRFFDSAEWQATRTFLPEHPGSVLDLGAGRGISSYALARGGWRVTALEPDPSQVVGAAAIRELARQADMPIEVVEQWGELLPFGDASFDLVYGRQVLHHAHDLRPFCREMCRVLRPKGRLIACREHVLSRREDLSTFLENHPLHKLYGGETALLLMDYRGALHDAGLTIGRILNPLESDINLHPHTRATMKKAIAARLHLPIAALLSDRLLTLAGRFDRRPGRLYSFIADKR